MKILIGTPVHETKDYAIPRWLKNVSQLTYPTDLLLIDNSPTTSYLDKLKHYSKKYKLRPSIKHLTFAKNVSIDTRIEASQETIRQYTLSHNYDAWFSWECDQLIPPDTLNKLVALMKKGKFEAVFHNSWARTDPNLTNTNMGVTLLSQKCLKMNLFLPIKKGKISLEATDTYNINDPQIYKNRILKSGGNFAEVFGLVQPIYHLDK